jgi:hypothetical protein
MPHYFLRNEMFMAAWDVVEKLLPVASALGGVFLGGYLTTRREKDKEEKRVKTEASYLAILLVAHLDRFASACLDVAYDDGTSQGHPAGEGGFYEITVTAPTFDPLSLSGVDWKVLPADLMYGVLNLPYKTEQLNKRIGEAWEFDTPPDFAEMFWTRQMGFAQLGLEVSELTRKLRKHAGLPAEKAREDKWDRDVHLNDIMSKLASQRDSYLRALEESNRQLYGAKPGTSPTPETVSSTSQPPPASPPSP